MKFTVLGCQISADDTHWADDCFEILYEYGKVIDNVELASF